MYSKSATVCFSIVEISALHGIHWVDNDTQKNLYNIFIGESTLYIG